MAAALLHNRACLQYDCAQRKAIGKAQLANRFWGVCRAPNARLNRGSGFNLCFMEQEGKDISKNGIGIESIQLRYLDFGTLVY